jgi:hypothetical protein
VFLGEQEDRGVKEKQIRISCGVRWLRRDLSCLDFINYLGFGSVAMHVELSSSHCGVEGEVVDQPVFFFCFLVFFSKDFLKYVLNGKISENEPSVWRHPRWRQGKTAWRR